MNDKLSTAQHMVQALLCMRTKHVTSCMELWYSHGVTDVGDDCQPGDGGCRRQSFGHNRHPLHFWKQYIHQLVSGVQGTLVRPKDRFPRVRQMVSCTRYLVQVARLPTWDKQAGTLTNDIINTDVQTSQLTMPTRHW